MIPADMKGWLGSFPLLANIGKPDPALTGLICSELPPVLNDIFWSERTHELESAALQVLSDDSIDGIFDGITAIIDADLGRFNPLVAYFGTFLPDGDETRIQIERDVAHSVKRDLAWAVVERTIGVDGFFSGLLRWYDRGRWPYDWSGDYPAGHVIVA